MIAKSVFVCVHMCRPVDDIRAWWVVSLREEQTDDGDMVMQTSETWWLISVMGVKDQAVKRWGIV